MTPAAFEMRWERFANPPRGGFFAAAVLAGAAPKSAKKGGSWRMWNYLWVMIGSALGGGARYWFSGVVADRIGETFPWGTLFINIIGSLVIGFFATVTGPDGRFLVGTTARQFVMVGICGGFTTFSAFSLQTLNLARDGEWFRAGAYIVSSIVFCLLAVWLGHVAAMVLNQPRGA
jgi:CrcB protein